MEGLKAPSLSSLISGTDRGSSDSLLGSLNLDLDEIDDLSIPPVEELPSLDAIMSEFDSDLDSISNNLLGDNRINPTPTPSFDEKQQTGSILRHVIFQGVTTQIGSASDRTEAGLASALAVSRMVAIGTSHGFILAFDSSQTLKWCCLEGQKKQQGAVSSMSFNSDDTRLLAGFSRGAILMINTMTGDVLRTLFDAISPNAGVLNIKWTSRATLALSLDTGGSVWSLSFTRRMGIRGCDSRCLFSGARGEVCALEPLIVNDERHPFQQSYTLVALATLSKFFILMIRPRLKVVKYHMLNGPPDSLPLLSWQMVLIQSADSSRSVDPVLATGRGSSLYFHQLSFLNGRISVTLLRHISLTYNLLALHWLGPKNIACVERNSETLHLIDVRTSRELETIDASNFGIVYSSAQFKGIATGGNVSPALALAGTFACYSTIVANDLNGTLYILGKRSLHGINARNWSERLSYLTAKQNWTEAFELAIDGYKSSSEKPKRHGVSKDRIIHLFEDYLNATTRSPELCLESAIKCLIEVDKTEYLWQELWERLFSHDLYLNIITQHILDDNLTTISPTVSQALLDYWSKISLDKLETIILKLNWQCLDLHQALSLVKHLQLFKAQMHLNTKALSDYTASLVELIPYINIDDNNDRSLGNNLLVYISSCLAGRGYPTGEIADDMVSNVKYEIMRTLTAQHSMKADDNEPTYPYLRELLKFDTRETLNVLSLAFMENEFSSELGLSHRQRIINILLEIVDDEESDQFGILCNFMSQQITTKSLPDTLTYLTKIINYITSDSNFPVNSRQHVEKEQTFLNLMEANALCSRMTFEELLEIAYRTKCFLVARFIYEKLKKYEKIIECFILSNNSYELFRYILEYRNNDERKIYQQIYDNFQSMMELESEKTTKVIIEYYPICVPQFLKVVNGIPKLHYVFLESLIANGSIPLETSDYNKFLTLQCQYNPENVLEFLQNSNHSYDIHHAMSVVEEKNLTTSLIYLHEKNGDYQKAFQLSMDLLKDSPESLAENYAMKVGYLCMRASNILSISDRESYWFELIEVILSRSYLSSIVKQILHLASGSVDLSKLVQLVMRSGEGNGKTKNFGDVKHILIGMLSNFEYESLLLKTSQNILGRDLHKRLVKEKQNANVGIYCKSLKCHLCKRKLSDVIKTATESSEDSNDQIIVFSICGHSIHNSCYQKVSKQCENTDSNLNTIICTQCGIQIQEADSFYLKQNKINWNSIPQEEFSSDLQLKAPPRIGFDYKGK
ncbi:CLUMA_CG017907, isoform A [Clunio marinus]|uniref:CLUMA_CG017907, isoform A n=1 Tax=Clunio marinus TaxID=568069 RepID=A0A1J1J0C0_9DIPT|nr:CLUMA_CG017907, isoform A [Clunio marinus]